jgi:hypothetical protein
MPIGNLKFALSSVVPTSVAISSSDSLMMLRCASIPSSVDVGSTIWGIVLSSFNVEVFMIAICQEWPDVRRGEKAIGGLTSLAQSASNPWQLTESNHF